MCRTFFCVPRHFVVGALSIGLAMPAIAAGDDQFTGVAGWRMLDTEQLDAVRGGMDLSNGLAVSFGLEQSILVNGEVVSRTVLNLQNLQQTIANQVEAARADVITATSGINAQVQTLVADKLRAAGLQTTVTQSATSQQAQAQSASDASSSVSTVSTDTVSQSIVAGSEPGALPTTAIQNGPGNWVGSASLGGNGSSLTTIIQNTRDNQVIQTLTELDVSVNSLKLMRANNMSQSIHEGVVNSLRK